MSGNTERVMIRRRKQEGFFFVTGAFLALMIVFMAMPIIAKEGERYMNSMQINTAAEQLSTLRDALNDYVRVNYAALSGSVTETSGVEVSLSDLRDGGFLLDSYSMRSPFGQQYRAFVFAGSQPDSLVSIVVSEGGIGGGGPYAALSGEDQRLVSRVIPKVAQRVGATGGHIPSVELPGMAQGVIEGSNGIWTFDTNGLTPFASVGQGSVATVQHFTSGSMNNDYLYRVEVPGQPELNEMNTHLSLGGHDITNARNVSDMTGYLHTQGDELNDGNVIEAERGNLTLHDGTVFSGDVVLEDVEVGGQPVPVSRAVFDQRRINAGGALPKPSCPAGSSAQPFASPDSFPVSATNGVQTRSGLRSGNLLANRVRAVEQANRWIIHLDVNIDGTWYALDASEGTLIANPKCT